MKCNRCQNENPKLFTYDHGVYYCRKCIDFSRLEVNEKIEPAKLTHRTWVGEPKLNYSLTPSQVEASHTVYHHLCEGKDVMLYAATGAGKTEICFESICGYLSKGKKVAFAISRRQVVLEIAGRLRIAFPELSICEVAQGYTQITDADIIVCTTHQLYRYPYAFDLLILDELDAFPFVGNEVLQAIANQACVGQKLLLSATPDELSMELVKQKKMELVCLFKRPHKHPLIVPKVIQVSVFIQVWIVLYLCMKFKREGKQILVFVPRKSDGKWLKLLLNIFVKTDFIHSSTKDKDRILDRFRNKEMSALVCTTLLERGITIPSVQVVVFKGDHSVFTTASLIQIFGRVGRSFKDPDGKGVCLCQALNKSIKDCVSQISKMNDTVYAVTNQ